MKRTRKSTPKSKRNAAKTFGTRYRKTLKDYLRHESEDALSGAYELGRRALEANVDHLEIAAVHHDVLSEHLRKNSGLKAADASRNVEAAGRFLAESLSPFALLHLRHLEANAALRQMNMMLEEEAKRIAHALHDDAASLLAIIYIELAKAARETPQLGEARVRTITGHLDQVREQLRRLSHEIHPPVLDDMGLVPALRFLATGFEKRNKLKIKIDNTTTGQFSPPVKVTLYRTVQETLNNIVRHARATQVQIRLRSEKGTLHCSVKDNGKGFDVNALRRRRERGMGLIAMEERVRGLGGSLHIVSTPGQGTTVEISVPEESE